MSHNPKLTIHTQYQKYSLYGELASRKDAVLDVKLYRNKAGQIHKKVEVLDGKTSSYTYLYDDRARLRSVRLNRKLVGT